MRFALALLISFSAAVSFADTTVTLLHFSDYHSHALPFFSEGRPDQGGVARAVGYLREQRKGPRTFVFSGGDMINKGSPAWSDKYGCSEWPWFNGIVDAMAYGNHEGDYGSDYFAACRSAITYPILGGNVFDGDGRRLFDVRRKPYLVLTRGGVKVGVFALAGSDFETLVRAPNRPTPDSTFEERVTAARPIVAALRGREKVDVVVLIGHAHREEDDELARAVSGIDVIFGSHSHVRTEPRQIEGTSTWYVSPFQYLTYISRLDVTLRRHRVVEVRGELVRVDASLPADQALSRRVDEMQRALEADPLYASLFRTVGTVSTGLSLTNQLTEQTPLGRWVMEIVRRAAGADAALSTTSSFRAAIAPGTVTLEDLRGVLPYPNRILVFDLTAEELSKLLALSESKKGSDSFAQVAEPSERKPRYRVATTDYLARVSPVYRDFFKDRAFVDTGLEVRDEVRKWIESHSVE